MCIQNKNKKLLLFLSYQKNIFSWVKIFKKFGDAEITEIKKVDFYNSKEMIDEMNVEIQKIIISDAFACGKNKETGVKCFIGYETGTKIIPLFIEVPQMIEYFNIYKKNR